MKGVFQLAKTMNNQKKATTGLVVTGLIAGASTFILMNKNAREKVVDTSKNVKDTVGQYATNITEDPQGTKDAIINRIQNATEISKEAMNKIQHILDTDLKEIKDTTQHVVQGSKEVMSTAKHTQDEIADIKDHVSDAKDELLSAKNDVKSNNNSENN